MDSLQSDLSARIDLKVILEGSNIEVKGLNPERIPCPSCHCNEMFLHLDPRPPLAGRWFKCNNCGVTGDAVKLGMMVMGESDYRTALLKMIEQRASTLHLSEITPEVVEGYRRTYVLPQDQARELWGEFAKPIYQMEPPMVSRRHRDFLYVKDNEKHYERWAKAVGGGTRQAVHRIFGRKDVLPQHGHNTNIILKYQDVPGRIASLLFWGDSGDEFRKFYADPMNIKLKEGGLALLDLLEPFNDTVYAVDDTMLGLQMQKHHLASYHTPLPLVMFNSRTKRSWESIQSNKLVLFSRTVNRELFLHAKKARNSFITTYPFNRNISAENLYKFVVDNHAPPILERMSKYAKPWLEALGEFLTNRETGEYVARDTMEALELTDKEKDQLFQSMPSSARVTLERLMGNTKIQGSGTINGKKMERRVDGFWVKREKKEDELFTDCNIEIERCTYDPDTRRTFWDGAITYKENRIRFRENVDAIMDDPVEWLRGLTKPYGVVQLSAFANSKNLFAAIQRLCAIPQQVTVNSRIGFAGDKIVFPNFTIRDGTFIKEDLWMPETVPAKNVQAPLTRSTSIDETNPTKAVYVAITAAFITNLMAMSSRELIQPVLVMGGTGTAAASALRHLTAAAGIETVRLENSQTKTVQKTRDEFNKYGYPTFLEPSGPLLLSKWPAQSNDHVFMSVNPVEATALGVSCSCMIVNGNFCENVVRPLPDFKDTLFYLADLSRRDFHISSPFLLVDGVLEDMCQFWTSYYGKDQKDLQEMARRFLHVPLSPSDAIIDLFAALYSVGTIQISHESIDVALRREKKMGGRGLRTMFIDDALGLVYLSRQNLTAACATQHVPVPDIHAVTQDMVRQSRSQPAPEGFDGWVLKKDYWDEICLRWQRRNSIR